MNEIDKMDYVVININDYNSIIYRDVKNAERLSRMYNVIYNSSLTYRQKYKQLFDILQGK